VNIVTDAAVLGSTVDGVLVVARAGTTDRAALAYAVQQLRHVRAPILGVVLNDIDFRRDASYDGAYRYYDAKHYSDTDGESP
jgi:Mrp family chromosome partitioning ATPase